MVNRANGTRANRTRANGNRANVVAPKKCCKNDKNDEMTGLKRDVTGLFMHIFK